MNKLDIIGSKEFVSFPDLGLANVPAKIDTGADYSAIWASNISEDAGELCFTLFDSGSHFFNGNKVKTREFSITRIKNSFGNIEVRYKVKLTCRLGGKKVKISFSLADRSKNRYPILIGRRTLHNKFIVDVSQNNLVAKGKKKHILVLNSLPSKSIADFVKRLNSGAKDTDFTFSTYDNFLFYLGGENAIEVIDLQTGKSVKEYDLVYFKTYFRESECAVSIAEYAGFNNIPFLDKEVINYHAKTKFSQYTKLARYGFRIPESYIVHYSNLGSQFDTYKDKLGLPFILKDTAAEKGRSNYLIRTKQDFDAAVNKAIEDRAYYVAQKFIPNNGDFRFIVLGKKVVTIFKRTTTADSHLTNTSQGGRAEIVDINTIDPAVLAQAVKAAMLFNRDVAGVDLMQDANSKEWFILEVNNSPQFAAGVFLEDKVNELTAFLSSFAER